MHGRTIKVGAGFVAALAAAAFIFPATASADYAPAPKDVVGVGSDTLQALGDFVADGSYTADPGYNGNGNKFKFISVDATADANTRLAYGPGGANGLGTYVPTGTGASSTVTGTPGCGAGTGTTIGTGNTGLFTAGDLPCVLAPTVVLRAGTSPEQRPNGSGAGYALLKADTVQAAGSTQDNPIGDPVTGGTWGTVNFSRASAPKNSSNALFDSITAGTDNLAMLTATTTNAVPLSKAELTSIYNCTVTKWNQLPGNSGGSADTIYAMIPQVGSGTRSVFLGDISLGSPSSCVHAVEENDPEAIVDSGVSADAIEPMSQTRLNLFQGISGAAAQGSINPTGYFDDPTCPFNSSLSTLTQNSGSNSPSVCQGNAAALNPQVTEVLTGTPGDSNALYIDNRNLYIYFRNSDIFSPIIWQPGGTLNWVRTMFYNPCTASITSTTILTGSAATAAGCSLDSFGNEVGPGGAPYFASAAGQQDIDDAGVTATWNETNAAP